MFVIVECENEFVKFRHTDIAMKKKTVAYILVLIDILSMFSVLIFINFLILMQQEFAQQFDEDTVEMRDFTVRSNSLPPEFRQYKD